jgi:dihydrofolate reductase
MRISVFVGVSLDGFIAGQDGSLDFLRPFEGEDHGYQEFMHSIDAIVVGRATYDAVLGFAAWPFADKRVVVLTHRPLRALHGETSHAGLLAPLARRLAAEGVRRVYLDGGVAIRQGLDEDLVDDMTISTVPKSIGVGRPLWGGIPRMVDWVLASQRSYPSGMVQVRYKRAR